MENIKSIRGLTLIEMIVVIGILAVTSAMTFAILNPLEQFKKTEDTRRKNDLAQIQRALEAYNQDFGRYPETTGGTGDSNQYKIKVGVNIISWGNSWSPYMNILPKDPKSSKTYIYYATSDGQAYYLYASLERGSKDPQACNGGSACPALSLLGIQNNACGQTCNYGVSSSNVSP